MRRLLVAIALVAVAAAAQEKEKPAAAPAGPRIQKLFVLKYAEPRALESMLRVFDATVVANSEMHALAITATPEAMRSIEDAIARLDTPAAAPKNVELTCYLVVGSEGADAAAGPIPKELDSVVAQLKNALAFKSYRVLDVLTLRARTGQMVTTTSSGGTMPVPGGTPQAVFTQLQVRSMSLAPDGSTVRLDQIRTQTRVPVSTGSGSYNWQELVINTDVDIKEGQKVVVGRVGITHDQALFLVLMAKTVS